jgi:hypothetical protein
MTRPSRAGGIGGRTHHDRTLVPQRRIYALDIATFQDSNDDDIGDLPGLINRLDYLSRLGVTAIWLSPDPSVTLARRRIRRRRPLPGPSHVRQSGDFAELLNQADERDADLRNLDLGPYGYRWLRLSRATTA